MTLSGPVVRTTAVSAFIAALLVAVFTIPPRSDGEKTIALPLAADSSRGIVVVGDSITDMYNDVPGDPDEGWWNLVARDLDTEVTTYAQSGSGYLRSGNACNGEVFIDRSEAYTGPAPAILIVEGGRNDWARCEDGRHVDVLDEEIRHAVATYLGVLVAHLPTSTRIVVLGPPWGPVDRDKRRRVTEIVQSEAQAHGLQFIDTTDVLSPSQVVDGVHPNRAGSLAIAELVLDGLREPYRSDSATDAAIATSALPR